MQKGEVFMPTTRERVTVFHAGEGSIEPTGNYSVEEVIAASDEAQKPIEDQAVVCIDERESAQGPQPVREKVAGGNLMTGLIMAVAGNWSLLTKEERASGPEAIVEKVADHLVDTGEILGSHRHNNIHDENETGCGAVDKLLNIIRNLADHAMETAFVEQAKIDLGDLFDERYWHIVHQGFIWLSEASEWQKWRTSRIQEIVAKRGGVVEVLNGEKDALRDPENKRHNHWAEAVRINHERGKSNDRDSAQIPTFQVDVDPIIRIARKLASSKEEYEQLLHAGLMWQYGVIYTLTRGMPIFR